MLGLLDLPLKHFRRDGRLIDIKEGDVSKTNLMQDDDELDEVRVGLLPEWFLIRMRFRRPVRSRPGRYEGVVGPFGIQTDFNVVMFAASLLQNLPDLVAEVTFDFKNEPAGLRFRICRSIAQQLVREWIHAASGLAAANSADDDGVGKQPALRNSEPTGFLCGDRDAWIVDLP